MAEKKQLIKWNQTYELRQKEIDSQHKKLVDLINDFYNAFLNAQANEKVEEIVEELIKYTLYHFMDEEELFKKSKYPKINEHKEIHKQFVDKLKVFQKQLTDGNLVISYDLMTFLRDWLTDHILGVDREYMTYINAS